MPVFRQTAGWILFILLAVYYFFNRYPGLAFIDSGELALCSYTLGVPHPTGYPLYLIISAPAAVFFNRPIVGVTLFSGLITALASLVFFHLITAIKHHLFPSSDKYNFAAASGTLILFLSPVVAAQGVTNEVYGLALLINLAVLLATVRVILDDQPMVRSRCLILAWYLAGLSLCNHMSSVQLIPGLAFITILTLRRIFSFRILLACAALFIIPLSLYAVLPIRAAADPAPIANWGDVTTWNNFIRHISGWQFQVWMFTGKVGEIWANVRTLAGIIVAQFPIAILPFIAVGIYYLIRRAKSFLAFLLIVVTVNIYLGINYSIPDIDTYYLMTIASLMLLALVGMYYVGSLIKMKYLLPAIMSILLIWQAVAVWDENRKSDYTLPEDFALNIGRSADYGAVIMSELWDHHGQVFYLQQVENNRPDLKFIDKELLRRSWYYKIIENAYPDLYAKIADLVPPFLDEIKVFESGGDFDSPTLEFYFQAIINRLLTECGPAYIDYRLTYTPRDDHYLRPQGVLYKVDTIRIETPLPQPELIWRGRVIGDYNDWRALHHVDIIKVMNAYW
jgi:hypothetical protein